VTEAFGPEAELTLFWRMRTKVNTTTRGNVCRWKSYSRIIGNLGSQSEWQGQIFY